MGDQPEPPGGPAPPEGPSPDALPEAAERRLQSGSFSSGLSVADFAACLGMGLRPVGLVQGFCAMQWAWYGSGSPYMRGMNPYAFPSQQRGAYNESYACPHGMFGAGEHRSWGQNYEQTWVEQAWAQGYGAAFERMVAEATDAGAHGIIGVTTSTRQLTDAAISEFHILGTAVVVEGGPPPAGGRPWTTFLSGQRLGKLFEAGFAPVSVAAALSSVRVWAYCITEYLMEGGGAVGFGSRVLGPGSSGSSGGLSGMGYGSREVEQVTSAHMAARGIVRRDVRRLLDGDMLHGAHMEMTWRELGQGDSVIECTLLGTRVRRFKDFDPLPAAVPTVRLA